MTTRLLQLTDLHLFAEADTRLRDVPTRDTFHDVLEYIESHEDDFDGTVITGDLTHDERAETYHILRTALGNRVASCSIIPGNHDDRRLIRETFPELVPTDSELVTFERHIAGWVLIGLDTHWPGEVSGRMEPAQFDWLRERLRENADVPTLLFMHHPPIDVGSVWMDRISLRRPHPFVEIVAAAPQVKAVFTGHVHHEFTGTVAHASLHTTPSTGVQFVPGDDEPSFDSLPPGYRVIELDGKTYRTHVVRLPELKYPASAD
jgi:Icc protein